MRALRWTFTSLAVLWWAFAVLMALLEVVHLSHGQAADHFAATFAAQAVVVAVVFSLCALTTRRAAEADADHQLDTR